MTSQTSLTGFEPILTESKSVVLPLHYSEKINNGLTLIKSLPAGGGSLHPLSIAYIRISTRLCNLLHFCKVKVIVSLLVNSLPHCKVGAL